MVLASLQDKVHTSDQAVAKKVAVASVKQK